MENDKFSETFRFRTQSTIAYHILYLHIEFFIALFWVGWSIPISFNMQLQSQLFQHNYFVISVRTTQLIIHNLFEIVSKLNQNHHVSPCYIKVIIALCCTVSQMAIFSRPFIFHDVHFTTWKISHKSIFFTLIAITLWLRDWMYILRDPFHLMHMKWASNLSRKCPLHKWTKTEKNSPNTKCKRDHHVYQYMKPLVGNQMQKPRNESM